MVDYIINDKQGQYWAGEEREVEPEEPEDQDLKKPKTLKAEAQKKLEIKIMNLETEGSEQQDALPMGETQEQTADLRKPKKS